MCADGSQDGASTRGCIHFGKVRCIKTILSSYCKNLFSAFTSMHVCITSIPLSFKTAKTKHGPTLKYSHQQLSSHLALSSHMLNEFILPILPVVENSDVNSYAMGLVATQRPETKCFHLELFCE